MASLFRLPSALRTNLATSPSSRNFHSTPTARASILFALNALSNSRETQHFNKLSHLHRVEHSPSLKLIKTSEIDPFPLPTPPPSTNVLPAFRSPRSLSAHLWDRRALDVGRVVLADNSRRVHRLSRNLERSHARLARQQQTMLRDQAVWQQERFRMRNELRAAGAWILATVGVATGLATWRFWPETTRVRYGNFGARGRDIVERTAVVPLPAVVAGAQPEVLHGVTEAVLPVAAPPAVVEMNARTMGMGAETQGGSWWKGLFWVQG